jgi:hypothetical protein
LAALSEALVDPDDEINDALQQRMKSRTHWYCLTAWAGGNNWMLTGPTSGTLNGRKFNAIETRR